VYKTAKNNFITSWTVDIIRTTYYIGGLWGDEINFCCFVSVAQRLALHVVRKHLL